MALVTTLAPYAAIGVLAIALAYTLMRVRALSGELQAERDAARALVIDEQRLARDRELMARAEELRRRVADCTTESYVARQREAEAATTAARALYELGALRAMLADTPTRQLTTIGEAGETA